MYWKHCQRKEKKEDVEGRETERCQRAERDGETKKGMKQNTKC